MGNYDSRVLFWWTISKGKIIMVDETKYKKKVKEKKKYPKQKRRIMDAKNPNAPAPRKYKKMLKKGY